MMGLFSCGPPEDDNVEEEDFHVETVEEIRKYALEQLIKRFEDPFPGIMLEDPPDEFPVVLKKENVEVSNHLDVDMSDGITLQVRDVEEGPVTEWNRNFGRAIYRDVRLFDRIYEVNGLRGDAHDLFQAMTATTLELMVRRPRPYKASLMRGTKHQPLGIDTDIFSRRAEDGGTVQWLLVKFVHQHDTVVGEFNKANWETPVRKGDRIMAVDGKKDLKEMKKLLESKATKKNSDQPMELCLEH